MTADAVETSPAIVKELQDFVKSQISAFKYPRAVEFVDELPYSETGKLLRRILRDDLAHLGDGSTPRTGDS